ncbi:MAG: aspartyl protease family protein, partial [Flammeovirgaceae bacterium]|nr:aspartyl protease family protein [Flammeovirgaceae bacterium]MDW8287013.1 aspartyl protease family protein [Flammeovirgaceae bacterium]
NPKKKKVEIPFQLVHNLIIVPVFINQSDTLRFILDTGVSYTMLTSLAQNDSLTIENSRKVTIYGLGVGESIEAIHSYGNTVRLPGIIGFQQDILIPLHNVFQLSYNLGTEVNGLIGFDIFNDFVVEINYKRKVLTLYDPASYKYKKPEKLSFIPLEIERRKPYMQALVENHCGEKVPVKLLVDSGASHALSLYKDTDERITQPPVTIHSFLGTGLSGMIHGKIGRIPSITVGDYQLAMPITHFPDMESIKVAVDISNRNGSLGADILRRFHVILDYRQKQMAIFPNEDFKSPFRFNLSGIEIGTPIPGLPIYEITQVRENSPAQLAGLMRGDQIVSLNGVNVTQFTMNDIIELFQSKAGRTLRIGVMRNADLVVKKITLQEPF